MLYEQLFINSDSGSHQAFYTIWASNRHQIGAAPFAFITPTIGNSPINPIGITLAPREFVCNLMIICQILGALQILM